MLALGVHTSAMKPAGASGVGGGAGGEGNAGGSGGGGGAIGEGGALSKNQKRRAKLKEKKRAEAKALDTARGGPQAEGGEGGAEALAASPTAAGAAPPAEPRLRQSHRSYTPLDAGPLTFKVVDLGNACWRDRHFTDDIQTRQYRSPEVIVGAGYDTSADLWSLACVLFEAATGDLLFNPKAGNAWSRDEDHLALMMELLGRMPMKQAAQGKHAKAYFTKAGDLRNIRDLRFWPLPDVLAGKYDFGEADAAAFAEFLLPMLEFAPAHRATAAAMLVAPWLAPPTAAASGNSAAPQRGNGAAPQRGPAPPATAPAPAAATAARDGAPLSTKMSPPATHGEAITAHYWY